MNNHSNISHTNELLVKIEAKKKTIEKSTTTLFYRD